jgi:GH24 family phage-related lysozyme (muramidase)
MSAKKALVIELAKLALVRLEGKRNQPYEDHLGHCTVGFGHLLHLGACRDDEKIVYSDTAINAWLEEDVEKAYRAAKRWAGPRFARMSVAWQLAFTCMAFQLGETGIGRFKVTQFLVITGAEKDKLILALRDSRWNRQTPRRVDFVASLLLGDSLWMEILQS